MAIDTKHVSDRRSLSFVSLTDAVAEADRIAASDSAGTLRRTGNWSPAQVLNHVSAFMEYPYDGYPKELSAPPWFIKVVLRIMKNKFMRGPLPVGVKIPKIPGGTVGATDGSTADAIARFKKAVDRLAKTPPAMPNPVFGHLSHQEWMQLHCRHAELHFGFLQP